MTHFLSHFQLLKLSMIMVTRDTMPATSCLLVLPRRTLIKLIVCPSSAPNYPVFRSSSAITHERIRHLETEDVARVKEVDRHSWSMFFFTWATGLIHHSSPHSAPHSTSHCLRESYRTNSRLCMSKNYPSQRLTHQSIDSSCDQRTRGSRK